ncbi:MAG TPA: YggS family pyridoxal phosphate-dependent enzyme [Mycobacteriales bacterium]|nr:YggS family pyridoxal phosphate-dependent enzyme [Mycobacteriales bacterium]HVX69283.1 YggS family pyridoxal phosphate-dependent enzyme [Mycobacteriales bacterium]
MSEREAELAANLRQVRARIEAAARSAGRDPAELTLIAVTKTYPASDVALLAELGVRDVGENRDQEAAAKHAAVSSLGLRWHFIGQLQRRKCRSVVTYADVVHSVDRPELAVALGAAADAAGRTLDALVQVSLDEPGSAGRGGVAPAAVMALAEQVASTPGLRLAGLMAVAPHPGHQDRVHQDRVDPGAPYRRLADLSEEVRAEFPAATMLSAGMSGDLEAAVENGATHLRVGTALLGRRAPVVG